MENNFFDKRCENYCDTTKMKNICFIVVHLYIFPCFDHFNRSDQSLYLELPLDKNSHIIYTKRGSAHTPAIIQHP